MEMDFAFKKPIGSPVYCFKASDDTTLSQLSNHRTYIQFDCEDLPNVLFHATVYRKNHIWLVQEYGITGRQIEEPIIVGWDFSHFLRELEEYLEDPLFFCPFLPEDREIVQELNEDLYSIYSQLDWEHDDCFGAFYVRVKGIKGSQKKKKRRRRRKDGDASRDH